MDLPRHFLRPEEKLAVAYHEAGHVVAGWYLEHTDPPLEISCTIRGKDLSCTEFLPKEDFPLSSDQLYDRLCMILSGRVTEKIFFNNYPSGTDDDLKKLSQIGYAYVVQNLNHNWSRHMNEKVGQVTFALPHPGTVELAKFYSVPMIKIQVRDIARKAFKDTFILILKHKKKVERVALQLLNKGILNRDDMIALLGPLPKREPV